MNSPKIHSEIVYNPQAFDNRYAIYLPECINLDMVDQLAIELDAVNYSLTKSCRGKIYLTADKFGKLENQIKEAWLHDKVHIYPSVIKGNESQLILIKHWLFFEVTYIKVS
jgi:hypothetical protein